MTSPSHTVAVSIDAPPRTVYEYLADPRNLPEWAAGLARSVEQRDGRWIVDSGAGEWEIEFAPDNEHLVADHLVTQPDGTTQLNPMRVLANGDGSEVLFTMFRAEAPDDATWEQLKATVATDLSRLQGLLAGPA